jgi:hypothetical protein
MAALGELIRAAPELSRNPATSNVQFVPKWTSSCAAQHFVAPPKQEWNRQAGNIRGLEALWLTTIGRA